ncbi:beta-ketoacyl-ACP synthase II [Paenibacillus eucommiae]|uniref:3-oxoacyl-[acyl-carrier-protein] synthase 2 n=1 Tax=Paenibacillus eucommiae TaxID=1355755 RepID=A0ABS4J265_9BACL|nr:beta-ketoacyl-ACP synthase II [Paenibacillus eucommiae]MBP1993920.1 3-oxoacyl-[acyl-carrier-protein] synthase II [Paenibacillus eucommiae]
MDKRVVITGMGCVTPLGLSRESTWDRMRCGVSGIDFLTRASSDLLSVKVAAEVKEFDALQVMERKEARRMDRFMQFAVAAAVEAVLDSGLDIGGQADPQRTGVWIGSGVGGVGTFQDGLEDALQKGYKRVSPFAIPMFIANMASSQVAMRMGAEGPAGCSVTACSSGSNSIGEAFRVIQRGDADVMIAGGSEAPICNIGLASFAAMHALSLNPDPASACCPFDQRRDGFVMGEGAGIVILESLEHAAARGADIYAELLGYGSCCDSYHITAPRPDGQGWARAMKLALSDAGAAPEDIDYINAHGTSTAYNDLAETRAIKAVFQKHAYEVSISSTKSMTGHLLGASGAVEAIAAVMAIRDQVIPPTINYQLPDEELDLDYTPNLARGKKVEMTMSNSFAFGGHNAVLIFGKYESGR